MSKELLVLKDQINELGSELLLASEYARSIIEKETQLGKRTEQGFASITDRFFDKLKELWDFLGEVEKGRNFKPLEADLIGFCSHKNCRYDNGPVMEYNHCLECPSRYTKTKDENGINAGKVFLMKDYCTQNDGDCGSCSLVSYNLDCAGNPVDDALEQGESENLLRNDTRCPTGLGE